MVAIPAPFGIERDEEQVGSLRTVEQRVGIVATGQLAAQLDGEPLRDRGLDQERAQVLVDPAEDLVGEVVEDEALAPAERLDQRAGIGPVAQRDRRQLESRDPALGALDEPGELLGIEFDGQRLGEIARRLLVRVAQVVGPQLDEPAVGSKAGERQRRVLPGQEDQVGEGRPALDQEPDQAVDRVGADDVVVVEDEHERVVARGDLVEERGPDQIDAGADTGAEQSVRRVAHLWPDRSQRRDEVANEAGEIVVGGSSESQAWASPRDSSQPATATVLP